MSIFVCAACGGYADADDGCEEVAGRLICTECDQDRGAVEAIEQEEYDNGTH